MGEVKATNLVWQEGYARKEERERLLGQKGVIVWFTGLSAAGKSTIAREVEKRLLAAGHLVYVLDGDNIRHGLNKNLGFSPEDRQENIRRVGEVAKLFADAGVIVLTAFISPYRADRDAVRALVAPGEFVEVFVECPVEVCAARDPKGLYQKAQAGEIKDFTGISAPYEPPLAPELILNTATEGLAVNVDRLLAYLMAQGVLPARRLRKKRRRKRSVGTSGW